MKVEIIDNFLEPEKFKNLQNTILDTGFPWFLYEGATESNTTQKGHSGHSFDIQSHNHSLKQREYMLRSFWHLFYHDHEANSPFFKELLDIIDKLDVKGLVRSKANLYPRTNEVIEHEFHYDYEYPHKSGLYSLNTNNGFTIMEDGKKIQSVANRMVLFDASKLHKSTTCSDENYRVNLVFNYF